MNSFFLSCKLSTNSEGSAEQSEAIGASVRTQVKVSYVFAPTYPFRHPGMACDSYALSFREVSSLRTKKAFLFLALFYHRKEKYFFYFLSYELYLLCFIFRRASSASLKVIFLSGLWIRRERRIRLWSGASVFWKIASLCFCIHFSLADA